MLGRNHALYGLTGWVAGWPILANSSVVERLGIPDSLEVFGVSCAIAAGASVLPDLDHPDSRPSSHFGVVSRLVAKGVSTAAGGHRMATHSALFALVLAGLTYSIVWLPSTVGQWCASLACGFCCSVALALIAPSFGIRIPTTVALIAAVLAGWWTWIRFDEIKWLLPVIAAYGVTMHIACDLVTRGGVPLFWPFTKRRIALNLFTVGGAGERVVSALGVCLLGAAA